MRGIETVLFLVVLGTVVAAFAGRLRVPAPALLVIAGLAVGLLPGVPPVRVAPDVVSLVVLPPLLYAASEELPWRDVRAVWRPVSVLAVGLVLASAGAVAAVGGGGCSGEHGVRARRGAGQHGPGGGQRARAAAVAAAEGPGAGAGRKPVQRRDQPGAVPDRGLRRGHGNSRPDHGGWPAAARRRAVRGPGRRRRGSGGRDRRRGHRRTPPRHRSGAGNRPGAHHPVRGVRARRNAARLAGDGGDRRGPGHRRAAGADHHRRRPGCSCTRSTRRSFSCWKAWCSASSACSCPP